MIAPRDGVDELVFAGSIQAPEQANLIQNAIDQKVDGIALTMPNPDALGPVVEKAKAAGIPVVGFNAGVDQWKQLGLLSYFGQDEKVAGQAFGNKLNEAGAKHAACVIQEQGQVQLEARCAGVKETFKGTTETLYVNGQDMPSVQSTIQAKLQQDSSIDYVVTLGAPFALAAVKSVKDAGSAAKIATFDTNKELVTAIKDGTIQFAVDQQPFLQGYLAIDTLWLYKTNGNYPGGSQEPVLTAGMFSFQFSTNVWVGVLVALGVSLAVGFVNGYVLVRTKLPSFLVTLATFLMLQGLNLAVTKLVTGGVASNSIADMDGFDSAREVFASEIPIGNVSVKVTVFWWLFFVAIATWVLLRTRVGNWIFAVGGNADSARAVGVPVNRTKIGLFMVVGVMVWFLGMHNLFAFDTVQSGQGVTNELIYIAAAVVGGCLLTGGYGSAVGGAIGAFIFGMTTQGIVYANWDPDWLKFFIGATLLAATLLNLWVRARATRR